MKEVEKSEESFIQTLKQLLLRKKNGKLSHKSTNINNSEMITKKERG